MTTTAEKTKHALYELREAYDECLHPIESFVKVLVAANHRDCEVAPVFIGNVFDSTLAILRL